MSFPNDITIHDTANKDKYSFAMQDLYHVNLTIPQDYTQNPTDPLTLKYTKWYGDGRVFTAKATQNGATNLYQFYLNFKYDDVETSDLYGSIKQVVTGPTQKIVNTESHYQVYIPDDCTCINGVKTTGGYDGYAVVPPTGLTLNADIVKTIYADVNGDNSKRVQGTLDGNNIKFEFNRDDWGALNFSHVRDSKGNLIYNLQDYVKQLTPKFTGKILNELDSSITYSKDDNDNITITAKDGYKIKDATLEYQPYVGAGNETLGNFTVADNKKSAAINIPDNVKNDSTITLIINGDVTTDLEHINPSLKADNVSIKITGNTVTLTANAGYTIKDATLDIGNSLFGDDTPLTFTVSPDKTTATVTVTDESLIDPSQEYNLTVHTEEVPTKPYTLQDVGLQCNNENVTLSVNNNTATLTAKSGYKITSAIITSKNKYDFSGSTRQEHNFTISADGSNATITLTPSKNLDYTLNVSSAEKPTPTETPTQPTPPAETQTNYKVDITQIKDYVDYKTDGVIITLTAKPDVTINSLRAVADLTWSGDTYQLDSSIIKIADNKKSATVTVPNDYNSKLGYTIVLSGDFTKNTPIPINPKATGTLHVYQLDDKTLEDFSTKAVETFNSGRNEVYDFQKFITQLYKLPFFIPKNESNGTTNILTGWYTINEPARLLNNNHYIKDLGNIKVQPVNNNGFDHNVTNCVLYLPFVSPISVSYETVLNHTVNIKYDTDLAGAKTTVNIFIDKELYKTVQVSIIENLDLYNIYNDSINGTLSSILNNTLDHCFIKVEYNKPIENLVSYETLEHNKLSNYSNFIKTRNANVSCGTQQEQIEIENLLNGGIYIK